MANKLANRVKVTVSGTPGTGTITLGSAVSGFMDFATAGVSNGNTVPYVIEDSNAWEIGVGTYTSSGTTLARTSITASSSGGTAISATSNAIVMISPLAADLQAGTAANNLVQLDGTGKIPALDGSLITGLNATNITNGTLSVSRGGTGLTSLTAGYIPYATATDTLGTNANFTYDGTNFTIGGTAARIRGDFSGINTARLYFQSSTSNGATSLSAMPNGTGLQSGFFFYDTSDLTNNSFLAVRAVSGGDCRIQSGVSGTGSYLPITFYNGGTERMRIASDGSVGIGTTSPGYKLDISNVGGSAATARLYGNDQSNVRLRLQNAGSGGNTWEIVGGSPGANNSSFAIYDATGAATRLLIDTSGNLGLGVTPSAWNSVIKAAQVLSASIISTNSTNIFGANIYYDSSAQIRYITSNYAGSIAYSTTGTGGWAFNIAGNGTAGAACTLTQAMTLDASGTLSIAKGGLAQIYTGTTNGCYVSYRYDGTLIGDIGTANQAISGGSTGDMALTSRSGSLVLGTGNSERARITSSGEFLVGTSTALNDINTIVQISAGSGGSRYYSAGKGTGYGALFGYENGSAFGTGAMVRAVQSTDPIMFITNNTSERMRITSDGSVLIGTTTTGGILRIFGSTGNLIIGDSNYNYYDANNQYFRNVSGTPRMVLDSGGTLTVGGTPSAAFATYGSPKLLVIGGSTPLTLANADNAGTYLQFTTGAANGTVDIRADARTGNYPPLTFITGNAERARIDSSGTLIVNNTGKFNSEKLLAVSGTVVGAAISNTVGNYFWSGSAAYTAASQTKNLDIALAGSGLVYNIEVTIFGTFSNQNNAGGIQMVFAGTAGTTNTTIYGSSSSTIYSIGNTPTFFSFGTQTKPNNTTLRIPISSTASLTGGTEPLFVSVRIIGSSLDGVSSITFS